ncbi:unnamed protein product [Rotaria sordida]|uniref:Uncharacterized protein n=1 Tax=Rotaria sordida TaxID=392033 RepID=A0A814V7M2_9BILA|nr:unnamed protein product [Rotaria sordida]
MSADNINSTSSCVFFKASIRRGNITTSSKCRQDSSSVTTTINKRRQQRIGNDNEDNNNDTNDSITKENLFDGKFKSNRQIQVQDPKDMGAIATIEINADKQNDQRAIFEHGKKINSKSR